MERRRIYLMRHGAVAYFDRDGRPVAPDDVPLTSEGRRQAAAAATLLDGTPLDRVISSDLRRAVETAALVAPGREVEAWPELREIAGDRFSAIPPTELEREFVGALHGIVPNDKRFLGGETIGELFDRVLPAVDRLLGDARWDTALWQNERFQQCFLPKRNGLTRSALSLTFWSPMDHRQWPPFAALPFR